MLLVNILLYDSVSHVRKVNFAFDGRKNDVYTCEVFLVYNFESVSRKLPLEEDRSCV